MTLNVFRFTGLNSSLALKAPVRCGTTANITLAGFQTIDGVFLQSSDSNLRILVKNQTDSRQNGIYDSQSGNWTRSADWDSNDDFVQATEVRVAQGATQLGWWTLTTADPITLGTSNITFASISTTLFPDGSAASPGINFAAENTTGFYRAGAGQIGVSLLGVSYAILSATKLSLGIGVVDASTVIGSAAKFWNPTYFGNPGTAIIHSFNRLKVGTATLSSGDNPQSTPDWLESLISATSAVGQITSISATGNLGIVGAARTSDYRSWAGAASGGSQGINGFAYNDDTGAGNPTACAVFGTALHKTGVSTGITECGELTIGSQISPVDITPSGGVVGGNTLGLNINAGLAGFTQNVSAALAFGTSVTAKFRKGIIALAGGLDASVGVGGAGVAFEMARNMSMRWLNSGNMADAEIWGNANGLNVTSLSLGSAGDLFLTRGAGATLQMGAADVIGSPVAQTLRAQSVAATQADTAGADFTIALSKSTGLKDGGRLAISATPGGASGSSVNSAVTAFLTVDAADVLALGDAGNPCTYYVYATRDPVGTKLTNYERMQIGWPGNNNAYIQTQAAGTGQQRSLKLGGADTILTYSGAVDAWKVESGNGHFFGVNDNLRDIGQSGNNRPRNVYVGTLVQTPALRIDQAPTAVTSAGATISSAADGANNLGHRVSININGTTYWFPCGQTAF